MLLLGKKLIKNKRGVSEVVGYILLISIAVAMSIIVYAWLKSYVPKEPLECPTDVAIMIKEANCTGGDLELTLRNNGKFSVAGYTIKAARNISRELATDDISKSFSSETGFKAQNIIFFTGGFGGFGESSTCPNQLEPGMEERHSFDISSLGFSIEFIDVVPVRCQQQEGKTKPVQVRCNEARIRQPIKCPEEVSPAE